MPGDGMSLWSIGTILIFPLPMIINLWEQWVHVGRGRGNGAREGEEDGGSVLRSQRGQEATGGSREQREGRGKAGKGKQKAQERGNIVQFIDSFRKEGLSLSGNFSSQERSTRYFRFSERRGERKGGSREEPGKGEEKKGGQKGKRKGKKTRGKEE